VRKPVYTGFSIFWRDYADWSELRSRVQHGAPADRDTVSPGGPLYSGLWQPVRHVSPCLWQPLRIRAGVGKKKRKSLIQTPPVAEPGADLASIDRFLRAYGELTDATAELYRRLEPGDPRRLRVHDALGHAQRVAQATLTGVDGKTATASLPKAPAGTSLELVRTPRNLPEFVPPPNERSPSEATVRPDESGLVRYARVREGGHRWPDESTLGRYLRQRPLPDESTLARWRRRRRELHGESA